MAFSCGAMRARDNDKLTIVWYGLVRNASTVNPVDRMLRDGATVSPGEGIQLFVSVKPAAFLYVIHQSPTGLLTVWWPSQSSGFNAYLEKERVLTLPARGKIHVLGAAQGTEAVYLIAAFKPVTRVDKLTKEIQWLFASAQAFGSGVPARQVKQMLPRGLVWRLDANTPVGLTDQRVPVATTVRCIGRIAGGGTATSTSDSQNTVIPEQIRGGDVVARVIRFQRQLR